MKTQIWANNSNFVRKGLAEMIEVVANDPERMKKAAEARMAVYDALPRAVRTVVGQYGQMNAVRWCKSRRITDKVAAVKAAYQRKLQKNFCAVDRLVVDKLNDYDMLTIPNEERNLVMKYQIRKVYLKDEWNIINIKTQQIVSTHTDKAEAHKEIQMILEDERHPNY